MPLTLVPVTVPGLSFPGDTVSISSLGDLTFNSDSDLNGAGDLIFRTGSSQRLRVYDDGYVEVLKDSSPLNYVGTHAALVVQQRDSAALGSNQQAPGIMFQCASTGDGPVVAASNTSNAVWAGVWATMTKSGDASGQCFTATGELHNVGAGGYNEIGGFQGEFTNISSVKGAMSGVEVALKDSPDSGVTSFDTQMSGVAARIAKYNSGRTNKWTAAFLASSEGTVAPDAILLVNNVGSQNWVAGIDLTSATLTSGIALKVKNNTNLSWLDSSGAVVAVFFADGSDVTHVRPTKAAGSVKLENFAGTKGITVDGTSGSITISDASDIVLNTGTGTKIGTATGQKLGFYNAAPVAQQASTGTATGFTAGGGTTVTDASTFTGAVGSTAYRISDIVKALKNLGLMAQ